MPLRRAADDLAVDDHGIDQHAAVLDHDVVEDLELTRFPDRRRRRRHVPHS